MVIFLPGLSKMQTLTHIRANSGVSENFVAILWREQNSFNDGDDEGKGDEYPVAL